MTLHEARALAITHQNAGRLQEAEVIFRQILAQLPDDSETINNLAIVYAQAGQIEPAAQWLTRALALNPQSVPFLSNAGLLLARAGRPQEAIAFYRRVLELDPNHAQSLANLGLALVVTGHRDESIQYFHRAVQIKPDFAQAWDELGNALRACGRVDEAVAAYEQATIHAPAVAEYSFDLANALQQVGLIEHAIARFRQAISLNPHNASYYNSLGQALYFNGMWDDSFAALERAVQVDPNLAMAHNNLANLLKDFGRIDAAIESHKRAIAIDPQNAPHHSNLIYTLHFHPGYSAADILKEQRHWNQQHAARLTSKSPPHENDRSANRRLRIGYFSPDFRNHVVGKNLLPMMQRHDHQKFEIFCYARVPYPDEMTGAFKAAADHWRDILAVPDDRAAEMIRADKIDILVDLALHMAGNRLPLFARKPAPVQATFGGYPAGTGLDAMDYRLTDPYLDPIGEFEDHYVEISIRLADSFWCFDPSAMGAAHIPVNPLPAMSNGYITFGCLNNFAKLNAQVYELWAQVLKELPTSRLLLLAPPGKVRERIVEHFSGREIDPRRVELVDRAPVEGYFKLHHRIDIGLDTLPYNGHTTSLDSLWMGVPVITLIGSTVVGRAGFSQLSNLKLEHLATNSPSQFVEIAVKLAGDLPSLAAMRAGLRERMLRSPLTDAPKFTRGIEAAFVQMWQNFLSEGKSNP